MISRDVYQLYFCSLVGSSFFRPETTATRLWVRFIAGSNLFYTEISRVLTERWGAARLPFPFGSQKEVEKGEGEAEWLCIFSDLSWFDRSIKTISRYTIAVG